ncbi:MAG: AAA family ATPase [Gammaproteobacteria bacterium]
MKGKASHSQYYRRLGLGGDPFPVTGIDDVLYLTPELEKRLKRIREWIHDGVRLIIVSAPRGAGKSRLCHHVETMLDGQWLAARIQARQDMPHPDLAEALLAEWSPEMLADNAVDGLHVFLEQAANHEHVPVAVIDNAHLLSADSLEFISELAQVCHGVTTFRFVLFAEDNIVDRLHEAGIMDEAGETGCYQIHLPALSETQTGEYIRHRILSYGHIKNDPFTEETIQHIYFGSGGLPGGINYLARQAIQTSPARKFGGKAVAAAVVLLSAVTGYQFLPETGVTGMAGVPAESSSEASETAAMFTTKAKPERESDPVLPVRKETIPTKVSVSLRVDAENEPSAAKGKNLTVAKADAFPETTTATGDTAATETETADTGKAVPERQADAPRQEPPPGESTTATTDNNVPARPATASPSPSPSPLSRPEESPVAASPRQAYVFDLKEPVEWTREIRGEDWLRTRPRHSVLLQIISAGELENVRRLVTGLPDLPEELSGFTNYTPSGQPRYRLYYGLYPDSDSAARAAAELPEELRRLQPWPRPLGDIIEELDEKQQRFAGAYQ